MDNLLEILVPLIFAAIYFFGNMLSGKKEDEDAPSGSPRRIENDDEDDAAERQRRIQEEIRRKIMERRRANSDEGPRPGPTGEVLRRRREAVEERREFRERERQQEAAERAARERVPEVPDAWGPTHEHAHAEHEASEPSFSWEKSDDAYDTRMQAQLRRIEETKRQAESLKEQAVNQIGSSEDREQRKKSRSGGYFRGPVRESLKDPAAARVAFIYGEVLGRPISMRGAESNVPGLNR